jgi:WD40 repeat protein
VSQRLRIFISSPGDVKAPREIAALTIERLAQDYARFFAIEPYLWEYEAMVASGHFQDSIEPPSAFDIVVLIVWSRLGIQLPQRTAVREYRGIDGRVPVTGTEWEFEEALQAAQQKGTPDLLVYRNMKPASFDTGDRRLREQQLQQFAALEGFWERHFLNQGMFIGAYTSFSSDAEFASALENHIRKLVQKRIHSLALTQGAKVASTWTRTPFRGLEAYEFEHAPIFFGQDEAQEKAMLRLTASAEAGSPFLLVLGASGSGKSSLVKAGIVPKLFLPRRVSGAAFLRRVVFRPSDAQDGDDLFDALARRLTTQVSEHEGLSELIAYGQSASSLATHLRNATAAPAYPIEAALGQLTGQARQSGRMLEYETAKLILVIDQLEELFTNERITLGERRLFIELLSGLVHSGLVWVIATMRKDFWHRADEAPELVHLSEGNGRLELLPPGTGQLSQMIRRPAEAAGVSFEVHPTTNVPLNEVISEEVAREPGALPLLSYLLDQLYRNDVLEAHGNTLTYATYEGLGRLEGAIATKAEAVLDRCAPEERQALGSVLFSLVQMDTAEGDVERAIARRVLLSTFAPDTPQRRLVEALLDPDARLLVSDADLDSSPTVRVAHEALISRWAQARDFVQRNADALKIRRRIEERYAIWRGLYGGGQPATPREKASSPTMAAMLAAWRSRLRREEGLLSDIDLTDGRRLLKEHRTDTDPHLVAYIERSVADNRRIRTRANRLLTAVAIVVTLLAVVASAAGWVASKRQHEAEYQAAETLKAQSRLLTEAAAQRLKDSDVAGAQGIILEVLTNPGFAQGHTPAAISVFQEIRAADAQLAVLSGHGDYVNSAAYSPDGTRIVTASNDKTARVWDARTGAQLAVLSGHGDRVYSAAYSPDGTRIVTASIDRTARIWDSRTGAQLAVLSGHGDRVYSAAYSPDGTRIVTASMDKTARVWDAHTGAQLAVLSGHDARVNSARYSPDGTRIVTSSEDKTARIWDARTNAQLNVLSGHGANVYFAAYSPDGTRIVTASFDKTARVWDVHTGAQLAVLSGHGGQVQSAAYSPDGRRIVTASFDKTVRVWDARTGTKLNVLSGDNGAATFAAYSPDGKRIVMASFDKTARIWDAATGAQLAVLSGHDGVVTSAAYSPDGERIVTASFDKTARVWDARTGVQLAVLSGHGGNVNSATYSPDGTRIVTASQDKTVRIWDARTWMQLVVLPGHNDIVYSAAYSPDGSRIVTASQDKTALIWDAHTNVQLAVLSGHDGVVTSAAYSPDGSRIVTASQDKTARVWDARTGAQLAVFGHGDAVESAAYSPDGTRIVTASDDNAARVWDAHIPANIAAQIMWTASAQTDPLPDVDRNRLGLPPDSRVRAPTEGSACDKAAAAFYDPDRTSPGLVQATIIADVANSACSLEIAKSGNSARIVYERGRAQLAKHDPAGAKRQFELAVSAGYRAARVDLANLLVAPAAGYHDPGRAVSLYAQAWDSGVQIAAFELGKLYEHGVHGSDPAGSILLAPDPSKAWFWYQKGAGAGEPNALARFAERDEAKALADASEQSSDALLLQAFKFYAASSERAHDEGWPDDAWRNWRYRRASLARILAREGMMQQVADAYRIIREK